MIIPPPVINSWIKIKLKKKDEKGKDQWRGYVENVSDFGVTISNCISSAGGGSVSASVAWADIDGFKYFEKEELGDYYAG